MSCQSRFESREAKNGKFYFLLRARNRQIIGNSEMYETARRRAGGIRSVGRWGTTDTVEDLTK